MENMTFAALVPDWLDAALIWPFRLVPDPYWAFWLGCACLALLCLIIGELTSAALFLLHRRRLLSMQDDVMRYHNLSVDALHSGNKEAYLAANKLAHEDFGRSFFAQAAVGMSGLWPLPFALGWLSLRFEGITLYRIAGTELHAGYVFVFITAYIILRILFGRCKKKLPLFARVEQIKQEAREKRGPVKKF